MRLRMPRLSPSPKGRSFPFHFHFDAARRPTLLPPTPLPSPKFTPLHWTYPKDRRRAEEQAAEAHAVAEALLAAPAAADIELAPAEGLDWSASSGGDAEEKLQPARTDSAAQPPPTKA